MSGIIIEVQSLPAAAIEFVTTTLPGAVRDAANSRYAMIIAETFVSAKDAVIANKEKFGLGALGVVGLVALAVLGFKAIGWLRTKAAEVKLPEPATVDPVKAELIRLGEVFAQWIAKTDMGAADHLVAGAITNGQIGFQNKSGDLVRFYPQPGQLTGRFELLVAEDQIPEAAKKQLDGLLLLKTEGTDQPRWSKISK